MHPIASVLNHGIPVCLCSDDPSAFGNLGLSFDFYQVLVSSEQTGLITLGEIALDSLKVKPTFLTIYLCTSLLTTAFSIRHSKRRKRNARSRCGRRGGRSFWRKLSRLGGICRPLLFEVKNSVSVSVPVSWSGATQSMAWLATGGCQTGLTSSRDLWVTRYLSGHHLRNCTRVLAAASSRCAVKFCWPCDVLRHWEDWGSSFALYKYLWTIFRCVSRVALFGSPGSTWRVASSRHERTDQGRSVASKGLRSSW